MEKSKQRNSTLQSLYYMFVSCLKSKNPLMKTFNIHLTTQTIQQATTNNHQNII